MASARDFGFNDPKADYESKTGKLTQDSLMKDIAGPSPIQSNGMNEYNNQDLPNISGAFQGGTPKEDRTEKTYYHPITGEYMQGRSMDYEPPGNRSKLDDHEGQGKI